MIVSNTFPTVFAKKIARRVELYTDSGNLNNRLIMGDYEVDEFEHHIALAEFQQMAIGNVKFEDCLFAYHGQNLSKKQKKALELIYSSTKPWVMGHIIGQLSEKLKKTEDKDFVDACEALLENLNSSNDGPNNKGKKLIVKLTK